MTTQGNKYILSIIDFATKYPEAIPLKNIDTETVADALISYMCQMGAVLCQTDNSGSSVTYISKKFQPGERYLSTIKKECLAIVWTLQKLKPYIWGRKFITDH